MRPRIWLALCSLFLILNLKLLIEDYDLISYMIVDENNKLYSHSNKLLLCTTNDDIYENDELINNKIINKSVSAFDFLNYTIRSIEFKLKTTNLFKLNQSFILANLVCFLIYKKELETNKEINKFLQLYRLIYLFSNPNLIQPIKSSYIYLKYDKLGLDNLILRKQTIYYIDYLSNPNCLDNELPKKRIDCTNKCFDLLEINFGFYNHLDKRKFNLADIANSGSRKKREINPIQSNSVHKFIRKDIHFELSKCFNDCSYGSCSYNDYQSLDKNHNRYKIESNNLINFQATTYLAYYLIDDFWLQLIGLIVLISGTCFIDLLLDLSNFLINRIKLDQYQLNSKFKKYFKLKFIFLFIILIFILISSLSLYLDYDFKTKNPNRTIDIYYSSKLPSLIICFPVQLLMFDDYNLIGKLGYDILLNYTFKQIEDRSEFDGPKLIKKIRFVYGEKVTSLKDEFQWKLTDDIIFKHCTDEFFNHDFLSRCFRIELKYLNRFRYEYLNLIHYLEIDFKTIYWNLFIIDRNQNFTLQSNEIKRGFSFRKKEITRLSKCNNLKNDKSIKINKCINDKFKTKFNQLSIYSLVNKNELNSSFHNLKFSFNRKNYEEIKKICLIKYDYLIDCNQIEYEETFKMTIERKVDNNKIRINLNHEYYHEYEFEQSLIKLFLDIADLVSISLGTTIISLLSSLNRLIKLKLFKIFIILICSIGFLIHNFYIFKGIINEQLISSLYFERLYDYKLPNILICIRLNKFNIDNNHKLTSNYLNELSEKLNTYQIFSFIEYFNKTNLNGFRPTGTSESNDEISIKSLYFLNFKCFEFKLEIEFNDTDFYYTFGKNILILNFNKSFIGHSKLIYILYRHSNSKQFSDSLKYKIELVKDVMNEIYYSAYDIRFESVETIKEDNFELLKNPLSLIYNKVNLDDATNYLNQMRDNYKEITNLTTRKILLENNNFNLEIDEDLFKQFYLQVQNYSDFNYPSSSNLKQNYYDCQVKASYNHWPYIQFSISSTVKKIKVTNQENYQKLVLSLLNTLSLWLDICILDLFVYLIYLFKLIAKFYYLLIRLKIRLKNYF